jgi:hypothetical protein
MGYETKEKKLLERSEAVIYSSRRQAQSVSETVVRGVE